MMPTSQLITLAILILMFAVLVSEKLPTWLVLIGTLTLAMTLKLAPASALLKGFSNTGVITVAALYPVAAGVYATGAISLFSERHGIAFDAGTSKGEAVITSDPEFLLGAARLRVASGNKQRAGSPGTENRYLASLPERHRRVETAPSIPGSRYRAEPPSVVALVASLDIGDPTWIG